MKRVSILDIAKITGLSRNTVAKALNLDKSVSYETRVKVIQTAHEMKYSKLSTEALAAIKLPAYSAQKNFTVLIARETSDVWNRIVIGICDEIRRNQGVCQVNFISEEEESKLILPENLNTSSTAGIICLSVFHHTYMDAINRTAVPCVFLDAPMKDALYGDFLMFEGEQSTYTLTSSLIRNGYKKIAFIGDAAFYRSVYEKWKGYHAAMYDNGLPPQREICLCGPAKEHYYKDTELFSAIDNLPFLPDAFVCANDKIAFDIYMYAQTHNLQIPEDLAVTGFDNDKESRILTPPLSTVKIDNYQAGKRLAQLLLWRLQNVSMPRETVIVSTQAILRKSSAAQEEPVELFEESI